MQREAADGGYDEPANSHWGKPGGCENGADVHDRLQTVPLVSPERLRGLYDITGRQHLLEARVKKIDAKDAICDEHSADQQLHAVWLEKSRRQQGVRGDPAFHVNRSGEDAQDHDESDDDLWALPALGSVAA